MADRHRQQDKDSPQASRGARSKVFEQRDDEKFATIELEEAVVTEAESSTLSPASPPPQPEQDIERVPQPIHAPSPRPQRGAREASVDSQDGYHTPSEFPQEEREPAASSREQPTRPHDRQTTNHAPTEPQSRPGTNTAPALSPQEERSLAAIPQDQSALLHETGRHVVNTPPTGPRPRLGNSLAYRLFESFLLAQDEPIPPVDMSTNEGKNRFIQVLQDFFQYAARRPESDGGIVRRGGLGLDMGNILTVLFPGFAGFTALVLSQRANSVPKQVRRPLGTFLRKGDLFWAVTNEWVADKHQELGDKSAPTNYGPILTAFRLQVVVDSDPDMLHVVYGRCRQFSGLEKIPDRQKWKNLRLLDESLPDNQPGNDSPHGNARVLVGDQWDNCMAINSLCHINVVEVQSITTMPWGWIYAGRLSGDALAMLDNLRKAYFNKNADIAPVPQELSVLATRIKDTDNNAGPVIEHRIGAARISVTPMAEPVQIRIRVRVPVVVHPVQGTTIVEHDLAMTVTTDQKTTKVSIRAAIKTIALLRRVSAIMSTLGPCSIP
ncbi:hypothetical protein J4E86_005902 [Alternaria arbusti]|uniref:uncharacterized protein n=1 Tax=Alternaria arbusti TaxID=232088 RepID=UPI002220DA52|nr:uncharacterized protein J4E86_005902 [Alternaria arbusti]KAI4954592.1 hypothetical protein J4E86_005902 [Alternaria arbusti]